MQDSLLMLKTLAEIVKTMQPAAQAQAPDQAAMMLKNYDFMNTVLQRTYRDTSTMYRQLMLKDLTQDETEPGEIDEHETRGSSMIEKLLPLFEKYIPILLGNSPAAQLTADAIKTLPEFQALLKDNEQKTRIIEAVQSEIGPAKTKKILAKLGVN